MVGVINIITGDRGHLTKYLAEHQDVQSVWYHGGSADAAKFVEYASADSVKRTWVDYGLRPGRDWASDKQAANVEEEACIEYLMPRSTVESILSPNK